MLLQPAPTRSWRNHYPFLFLLLPLLAGIFFQSYFPAIGRPILHWPLLISSFCLGLGLHRYRKLRQSLYPARIISLLSALFFLGALLHYYQDVRNNTHWYGHFLDKTDAFQVKITGNPEAKPRTRYLPITVTAAHVKGQWIRVAGAAKLYIYLQDSLPDYNPGDVLLLPNRLLPIRNAGNPFNFDYAGYAGCHGIFHQSFLSAEDISVVQTAHVATNRLARIQKGMLHDLQLNVQDSTTRSLIAAILLNERSLMDDSLWQAYSVTGIVHIIAISGMHVVMLCSIMQFLFLWLQHKKWQWIKYLLSVPLVWIYVALTGFPPSAVRAATMFSLIAISMMAGRSGNAINTWSATAFILLAYNPYWLYNVGVQLSFLAVLSILLFYKPIRNLYTPGTLIVKYIWETLSVSMAAQILVFPLVIYYFHQFPLWVLLVNIPAALYSFVLMLGALLLCGMAALGLPCIWLGNVLTWCTHGFHHILFFFAAYTPTTLRALHMDLTDFWLMTLSVLLLCWWFMKKNGLALLASLLIGCSLVLSFILQDWLAMRQQKLVVYNTSRASLVDYFYGKKVIALNYDPDTLDAKTWQYTLAPAHLGYRATRQPAVAPKPVIRQIGSHTLLLLQKDYRMKGTTYFPVDYLVVNNQCSFQPEMWLRAFHPKKIIIDGSLPRWKALKWKQKLEAFNIPTHWVQEDGAFIVAANNNL